MIALLDTITVWAVAGFFFGAAVALPIGILIGWTQKVALDHPSDAKIRSDALADLVIGNQGLKVVRIPPRGSK